MFSMAPNVQNWMPQSLATNAAGQQMRPMWGGKGGGAAAPTGVMPTNGAPTPQGGQNQSLPLWMQMSGFRPNVQPFQQPTPMGPQFNPNQMPGAMRQPPAQSGVNPWLLPFLNGLPGTTPAASTAGAGAQKPPEGVFNSPFPAPVYPAGYPSAPNTDR